MIRVGTLFSGGLAAAEFALKYENIEHEIVFACEWDKYARKQYVKFHNYSGIFERDVRVFNYLLNTPLMLNFNLDLLVWGSPCQDLSLAGKRKGFNGEKSSLFRVGAEIQSKLMPKNFIFENVKGLLSSNNGADYKEVCDTFRKQGYHIVTLQMNTKDYGIPQNRERIFIIGFLDEIEYHNYKKPEKQVLKLKLKDMLQEWIPEKYFLSQKMIDGFVKSNFNQKKSQLQTSDICSTLLSRDYKDPKTIKVNQIGYINKNSQGTRVYDTQCYATLSSQGGGLGAKTGLYQIKSNTKLGYEVAKDYDCINIERPSSQTRRGIAGKGYAQTLQTAGNIGVIYNSHIRRLTPFETFRLQDVKDEDINLVVSDTQAYKISGNAISVNVMQHLFKSLYKKQHIKDSLLDFM